MSLRKFVKQFNAFVPPNGTAAATTPEHGLVDKNRSFIP